jgi:hypothetical protein
MGVKVYVVGIAFAIFQADDGDVIPLGEFPKKPLSVCNKYLEKGIFLWGIVQHNWYKKLHRSP